MKQIEQSQNFKQQHLNIGREQIRESNIYQTRAVVANYISRSLVISALVTALFADALAGYNNKYTISLLLYLCSYIPSTFEIFFDRKAIALRAQAQSNIDLANGREIAQIKIFVDPVRV